jgi:adenine-specific DNA methylase
MTPPKNIFEAALGLGAINVTSFRERFIYRCNPSGIIQEWWAQGPLAAPRAELPR